VWERATIDLAATRAGLAENTWHAELHVVVVVANKLVRAVRAMSLRLSADAVSHSNIFFFSKQINK